MSGPLLDDRQTRAALFDHLDQCFREHRKELLRPVNSTLAAALPDLRIARIEPSSRVEPWVYISVGAWRLSAANQAAAEYMMLASEQDDALVDWISAAILRHRSAGAPLDLGAVVPLGQAWRPHSDCDRLMVTLPYPYGPALEDVPVTGITLRVRWLLPIDPAEEAVLRAQGIEALEQRLEQARVDFLDPLRDSVG